MLRSVLFMAFMLIAVSTFSQKSLENVYAAPNPFSTNTNIFVKSTSSQSIEFSVKNILGKTVHFEKVLLKKGKNSIPFSKNKLKSGLYIYTIKNKKEFYSKRILIQ